MIDIKLLSLVLHREVEKIIHVDDAEIVYKSVKYSDEQDINLDTLTRKMKEWCGKQGFNLSSGFVDVDYNGDTDIPNYSMCALLNLRIGHYSYNSRFDKEIWNHNKCFEADTEFEAVKQAAEWVANEKELL